jgi:hypothetical protein
MPKYESTTFTVKPPKHEIFPDGTYFNAPTVETKAVAVKPPKLMEVFKTKSGSQYQVIHLDFGGVYVFGHPYTRQPRVQDCDFWEMDKFLAERADG